jgi:hypothetical protein
MIISPNLRPHARNITLLTGIFGTLMKKVTELAYPAGNILLYREILGKAAFLMTRIASGLRLLKLDPH